MDRYEMRENESFRDDQTGYMIDILVSREYEENGPSGEFAALNA